MDNQIFNVNGKTKEDFEVAIKLAIKISGYKKVAGYKITEKGFILLWSDNNEIKNIKTFPFENDIDLIAKIIWQWLQEIEDHTWFEYTHWEGNYDHDGHNTIGWIVYTEDWGRIEGEIYSICAVKPAYLWHGK